MRKEDTFFYSSLVVILCMVLGFVLIITNEKTGIPSSSSSSSAKGGSQVLGALSLIRSHESLNGQVLSGDNGLARGQMHFHRGTWDETIKSLGFSGDPDWSWERGSHDTWRCYIVTIAYWHRYCPEAIDRNDLDLLIRSFRLPTDPYRLDNNSYLFSVKQE